MMAGGLLFLVGMPEKGISTCEEGLIRERDEEAGVSVEIQLHGVGSGFSWRPGWWSACLRFFCWRSVSFLKCRDLFLFPPGGCSSAVAYKLGESG